MALMHFKRRLLLGIIIGLVTAGFLLLVVHKAFASSGNGVSVADLGEAAVFWWQECGLAVATSGRQLGLG